MGVFTLLLTALFEIYSAIIFFTLKVIIIIMNSLVKKCADPFREVAVYVKLKAKYDPKITISGC